VTILGSPNEEKRSTVRAYRSTGSPAGQCAVGLPNASALAVATNISRRSPADGKVAEIPIRRIGVVLFRWTSSPHWTMPAMTSWRNQSTVRPDGGTFSSIRRSKLVNGHHGMDELGAVVQPDPDRR